MRINPPIFFCYKVAEDPKSLLDEVYNIVHAMGVASREKTELSLYQLKDVAEVLFIQWTDNRMVESGSLE